MPGRAALDQAQRLLRWGRFDAALERFGVAAAALTDDRDRALALLGTASALKGLRNPQAALNACRAAVKLEPQDPAAQGMMAVLLADTGALAAASRAAAAALALAPGSAPMLKLCAAIALRRGHREAADAFATRVLADHPNDQRALSLLALSSDAAAHRLLDLERLVLVDTPATPPGFGDLDAFNAALADAILRHPALQASQPDAPLARGRRLPDIRGLPSPLLRGLEAAFQAAAARLSPRLANRPPGELSIVSGWANVMGASSAEAPHIHEGGVLSGVYYAAMPADGGEIVLGGHDLGSRVRPGPVRTLRPRPGQLLLFPSYLYHAVPPLRTADPRISIAVDLATPAPRP